MTRRPRARRSLGVTLLSLGLALSLAMGVGASAVGAAPPQDEEIVWYDVDGNPLPFQDHDSLMAFLRDADIVENKKIGIGITGPRQLVLELDGVRMSAAFRNVDVTHSRVRLPDGSYFQRLRDYDGFEIAAYRIAMMLGMDNVPPAVPGRVNRDDGTFQVWVEDTMMERERLDDGLRSPDPVGWRRQMQEMMIFDDLIGNVDRNSGNLLIDKNWKVWLIDHTRAFQQGDEIKRGPRIMWVRKGMWEGLQALDKDAVTEATRDYLDGGDINDIFARRELLIERIQGLIDERGPEAVLW